MLDPNMPADEMRLHMAELSPQQVQLVRAAIAWANRVALRELQSPEMREVVAEKQANGWIYRTHPQEKARIVLAAVAKKLEG